MKHLQQVTRLIAAGLLLSGLCASMFAQERDRAKNETSMTGCLSKDASGSYTLTDEKTGVKTTVTGSAELEKHSANHKVTLTGTTKPDASGKSTLEVSKIQHVSPTCKAPSQ
jgi:hypothetical protein